MAAGNGQAPLAGLADDSTPVRVLRKGDTIGAVQAGIEGVPVNVESVPLKIHTDTDREKVIGHYRVAESIGLMPMLKFAHAAGSGLTEDSMEGMAAMYAMIRDCIHPDDWDKFERDAINNRAEAEDLMEVVGVVMEVITARPTEQPSGSSPPESTSSRRSKRVSSGRGSVVPEQAAGLSSVAALSTG